MADFTLISSSPLNGFKRQFGDTWARENSNLSMVSIATPLGQREPLEERLRSTFQLNLPTPGHVERNAQSQTLLGLQMDMCFLVDSSLQGNLLPELEATLGNTAYLTEQSDSWAVLELTGSGCLPALERICPIDLADESFSTGQVARTSMEHLSVIVERPGTDIYRLYSPRSSAQSFLHAVTLSLQNVCI